MINIFNWDTGYHEIKGVPEIHTSIQIETLKEETIYLILLVLLF